VIGRDAAARWAGGLPRTFWWLWLGVLVNRVGTVVQPFLALYLTTGRHLSVAGAGAVVAVTGAGSIASQPLGGALADRAGRRPTIVGGMVASGLAITALALAHAIWLVALFAFVVGVTGDLSRPASTATIADVVPVADRRRASGLVYWVVNVGFSIAAVAGGLLAARGYGLLFALDATTCCAYALVVWRTIPETRPAAAVHDDAPGWGAVLRDRLAMALFGLNVAVITVYAAEFTIMPLAMRADGLPASAYGAVVAANGIGIVVLQPLLSARLLRLKPASCLAAGTVLAAIGVGVVAVSDHVAGYGLAIAFITLGEIANATGGSGLVAEIAPPALRGRYAGAYGLTFGVAFTVTPLVGGALLGDGGAPAPWIAAGVLSVAAGAGLLALGPALEARRAVAV